MKSTTHTTGPCLETNDVDKGVDDHVPAHEKLVASHELNGIRNHIDAVDSELVRLLTTRLELVVSAAEHKPDPESVADPERVSTVLERMRASAVQYGANPSVIEAIYRVIIGQGIELEKAAYHEWSHSTALSDFPVSFPNAVTAVITNDLLGIMATMRAMRRLDDRSVPDELLKKLVQAASWAPVGANRQTYRFVIVKDKEQLKRLAPHWANAMKLYLGALCPSRTPDEQAQFERVRAAMEFQRQNFSRIPALIVVCYEPVSFWRRAGGKPRSMMREAAIFAAVDATRGFPQPGSLGVTSQRGKRVSGCREPATGSARAWLGSYSHHVALRSRV